MKNECEKIECTKKTYNSKKEAKKAVSQIRKTPLYLKGRFIKKARQVYQCPNCSKWLITSRK